jgi:hypothetical protein
VKEMENPVLPAFDIEKATKALQDYKKELEEMKCEGLTDKQVGALMKLTQELIPSSETEK